MVYDKIVHVNGHDEDVKCCTTYKHATIFHCAQHQTIVKIIFCLFYDFFILVVLGAPVWSFIEEKTWGDILPWVTS